MTGSADRKSLAVVHLVVKELGLDYFRNFIRSYRTFDAGADHTLMLALKQFDSDADFLPYQSELSGIAYEIVHVPDRGHDIGSYLVIARVAEFQTYCFINSKTELNAANWLKKLMDQHHANLGGITGATGSWQSLASDALKYETHRRPAVLMNARRVLGYLRLRRRFPKFPNPHIRTNVFVVGRVSLLSLEFGNIGSKDDTWQLESGRNSISRQIEAQGGALLIVDSKGQSWRPENWAESGTFWQDDQQGLLARDRQTRIYEAANSAAQAAMTAEAWEKPRLPLATQTLIVAALAIGGSILAVLFAAT